jgi:23S rRNA pseudouridine2605 synthase
MAESNDQKSGDRIAKVMARAGLCSRREAEAWIAAGRVTVNGQKISSPALNVSPSDRIVVDGKPMPQAERTRLYLYHKPRGLVTTSADPEGRPTIFDALPKGLPRLVTVGRLDLNTEGLLLLTNDGGLARVLEHPDTGWLRRYRVRAHGRVTQAQLDELRPGVTVDGVRYGPIEATMDREQGANSWITFAIREGKNREVRNVLEHLGLQVNRLIRISFGPFQLGDLDDGAVEEISTRHLKEQLGEKISKKAGADFEGPMKPVHSHKRDVAPSKPDETAKDKSGNSRDINERSKDPRKDRSKASRSGARPHRKDERKSPGGRPQREDSRKAARWYKGARSDAPAASPRPSRPHNASRPRRPSTYKGGRKK